MKPGWESICRRCGLCCFEKTIDERGRVTITPVACRHLDIVSRECRVYHKRLEVGEGCVKLTPEIVARADWLPELCAYRQHVAGRTGVETRAGATLPPLSRPARG